mmetsp:Transcript_68864/g.199774  ORF Transcript_68864/g.199774 Transcript_68864/m.199774 type:complete len:267 (+) Transcript_68864:69-869(+)
MRCPSVTQPKAPSLHWRKSLPQLQGLPGGNVAASGLGGKEVSSTVAAMSTDPTDMPPRWSPCCRCFDRSREVTALCLPNELSSSSSTDCVTMREFCNLCKHTISSASSCGKMDSACCTSASAAMRSSSCCSRSRSILACLSWLTFSFDSNCALWMATARSEFCSRVCASCILFCRRMSCETRRCSSPAIFFCRSCINRLRSRSSVPWLLVAAALARFCESMTSLCSWMVLSASFFSNVRVRPSSMVAACRRTSSRSRQIFASSRWK